MSMNDFLNRVAQKNPHQPEFMQAVTELAASIWPEYESRKDLMEHQILDSMVEPERQLVFRVVWEDDRGEVQVNRGYRIQYNSALGPYKGGMRFHPSVNTSTLKALGFEQIIKNSLTGLAMGSGKGGSDFDPRGKSDSEIRRFCNSLMTELFRHIGPNIDVPSRDLGVGEREIGYMFGAYNRVKNDYTGVFTGRSLQLGGSPMRTEAAGYGCAYFVQEVLQKAGYDLEGKKVAISGAGNLAQYAIAKISKLGGLVVTVSDSTGMVHIPEGMDAEQWDLMVSTINQQRGTVRQFAEAAGFTYHEGKKAWDVPCDIAIPCADMNEMTLSDAKTLISNGCFCVAEGANMAVTADAAAVLKEKGVQMAPSTAAGAGGVAASGFEMSQTSQRLSWNVEEVDRRLMETMKAIHEKCVEYGSVNGGIDYVKGANLAGFFRVAEAMIGRGMD